MSLMPMSEKDIIKKGLLVREPIGKVMESIDSITTKGIILAGPKHSGKSIILRIYEDERKGIYLYNDPSFNTSNLNAEEQRHYYELILLSYLYDYAKEYSEDIYEKYFKRNHDEILAVLSYSNFNPIKFVESQKHIIALLERIKNCFKIEELALLFDRFDWPCDEQNRKFQELMLPYIKLFDKFIITTEEQEVYSDENRKKELLGKGFSVIDVDYGKDIETTKKIISTNIAYLNANFYENEHLDDIKDLITPDTYNFIIDQARGNLGLLFYTILEFYSNQYNHHYSKKNIPYDEEISFLYKDVDKRLKQREGCYEKKKLYI